tara:strand:- start:99 stop:920 length:822 start_codon:yes stop_codon:yes gene_type:complete
LYRKEIFKNDEIVKDEERKNYIEKLVYVKITKNLKGLDDVSADGKVVESKERHVYTDEIDVFHGIVSPDLKVLNNVLDSKMKQEKMKKFMESVQKRVNDINYKKLSTSFKKNRKNEIDKIKKNAAKLMLLDDKKLVDPKENKKIKKLAKIIRKKIVKDIPSKNEANLNNLTTRENQIVDELSGKLGDDVKVQFDQILVKIYSNIIKENNRRYKEKNQREKKIQKKEGKKIFNSLLANKKKEVVAKQKKKIKSLINIVKGKTAPPGEIKKVTIV